MYIPKRQRGMSGTLIIYVVITVGFIFTILVKLYPMYFEAFKVQESMASAMRQLQTEKTIKASKLHSLFLRSANINAVTIIGSGNVAEHVLVNKPKKRGEKISFTVRYDDRRPLFYNLDIVLKYDKNFTFEDIAE